MKDYQNCHHVKGDFIGFQPNPFKKEKIALFNCARCKSTFAVLIETEHSDFKFNSVDIFQAKLQFQEA